MVTDWLLGQLTSMCQMCLTLYTMADITRTLRYRNNQCIPSNGHEYHISLPARHTESMIMSASPYTHGHLWTCGAAYEHVPDIIYNGGRYTHAQIQRQSMHSEQWSWIPWITSYDRTFTICQSEHIVTGGNFDHTRTNAITYHIRHDGKGDTVEKTKLIEKYRMNKHRFTSEHVSKSENSELRYLSQLCMVRRWWSVACRLWTKTGRTTIYRTSGGRIS